MNDAEKRVHTPQSSGFCTANDLPATRYVALLLTWSQATMQRNVRSCTDVVPVPRV